MGSYTPRVSGGGARSGGIFEIVPSLATGLGDFWNALDLASAAEGASVRSWTGRNGFVLSAATTAPTFTSGGMNGNPCVFFDKAASSKPLICTSNIFSGAYSGTTVALVMQVSSYSPGFGEAIACLGTSNPPNVNGLYGSYSLVLEWDPTVTSNNGLQWSLQQNQDLVGSVPSAKHRLPFTREIVMFQVWDGTAAKLWIDGFCVDSSALAAPLTFNGGVGVGPLYITDTAQFNMRVAAVGAWRRGLTNAEVRITSKLLREQFMSKQRRVIFLGDSTYEGTGSPAGGTLIDVLNPMINGAQLYNCARGGNTIATQNGGAAPYPELYDSIGRGDVVIVGPGSIDISNLVAEATVMANHVAIVSTLKAKGAIVICPTMIDMVSGTQATSDANRATYNTAILGGTTGAQFTVDLTGVANISANDAHSNTTYFIGDGAHLTAAGIALQAPPFVYVIQQALGYA